MNNKNTADESPFEVEETAPFDSQTLYNLRDLRRYVTLALWKENHNKLPHKIIIYI
jgi:hypothetical protein